MPMYISLLPEPGTRLQGPATTQTTYRVAHMWASLPHADQVDPASYTF